MWLKIEGEILQGKDCICANVIYPLKIVFIVILIISIHLLMKSPIEKKYMKVIYV